MSLSTRVYVSVSIACLAFSGSSSAEQRTWTSAGGKHTIEAELVDYSDKALRLKRADGKLVLVQFDKLIDEDKEFVHGSPESLYRLDEYLKVANPREGMHWHIATHLTYNGVKTIIIQSGKDALEGFVQITPQPLPDKPGNTEKWRLGLSKVFVDGSLEGMVRHGMQVTSQSDPSSVEGEKFPCCLTTITMQRPDGASMEGRFKTLFGKKRIYHFVIFAPSAAEADELCPVSQTIRELAAIPAK